jgi:hypothetical protein
MRGVLALLLLTSCSFALTNAPEPHRPCPTSRTPPLLDAATAVAAAGLSIAFVVTGDENYAESDAAGYATLAGLSAGLVAIAATRGFSNVGECREHNRDVEEEQLAAKRPRGVPQARLDAWEQTKQAEAAARTGDCATVVSLEKVVRTTDPELHATVFMRDVAIVRCLATTANAPGAQGTVGQ